MNDPVYYRRNNIHVQIIYHLMITKTLFHVIPVFEHPDPLQTC
jgi:hypothetical protein